MDDLAERERRSPSSCWTSPYALSIACWRSWRKSPRAWTPPPSERSPAAAAQTAWVRLIAARRSYRHTMRRGIHLPLIDPEPSPTGPLKVCRQRTITVSPEAGAKQWQALDYGSTEWRRVYFRLRNSVEGYNGYAKNPLAEGIESAGSRRVRGIAASRHKRSCSPSSWPTRTAARSKSGWTPCRSAASVPVGAPTTADRRKSRGAGPRPATWPRRRRSIRPAVQHRQRQAPPVR